MVQINIKKRVNRIKECIKKRYKTNKKALKRRFGNEENNINDDNINDGNIDNVDEQCSERSKS